MADNVVASEKAVEEDAGQDAFYEAEASDTGDDGMEASEAEGIEGGVSTDERLAAGGPPDAPGGNSPGDSDITWSGAITINSATTETGKTYSSTTADQNAVLVNTGSGVKVTLNNPTVTKSGGTSAGDDYSFYGINSAVMCKGGGTTNASNLTITTSGGSSAPIRTDRGGGTVVVDGGTYTSSGTCSPAIYSVADVTVRNATLVSKASEGAVMEGGGDITLTDCDMTDTNTTANSNAKFYDAVMLYQSFSGDATGTESVFTMTGGSLTSVAYFN